MQSKFKPIIPILFLAVFFLPSCLHYEEHYRLNDNGSGTLSVSLSIQKSMLDLVEGMKLPFDFHPFESRRETLESFFQGQDQFRLISVVTNTTNGLLRIDYQFRFRDVNRIPRKWFFKNRDFFFENDGTNCYFKTAFVNRTNNNVFFQSDELLTTLLEKDSFRMEVAMPGTISACEPSNATCTGKHVVYDTFFTDILANDRKDWSVTSKNGFQGFSWKLAFGSGIILLLGMILLLTVGNQKKR
jgi:hypothetical protein